MALLAALALITYGTQPNRMLVVRLKAALPRSRRDRIHSFDYTIVHKAGKLHIYDLEEIQGLMRARLGIHEAHWNRAPSNNHVVAHVPSSPQAALDFLTQPRESHPRCIPTDIRLLHVDRVYGTRTANTQRINDVRHAAASVIQSAARNASIRRNIFRPPNGPGYLAAMRRFGGMQSST